jgi:hypothetical protein
MTDDAYALVCQPWEKTISSYMQFSYCTGRFVPRLYQGKGCIDVIDAAGTGCVTKY